MTSAAAENVWHVVRNDDGYRSLWPDFRRDALPAGWAFTGVSGSRDECLRRIAESATESPVVAASKPIRPRPTGRATTTPFPRAAAPWRLIVLPHAGSGASYYHFLARALKDDPLEVHVVQYPGREMRVKEPPLTSMPAMVEMLHEELHALLSEKPFALFGHSMGALAAFELTRRLAAAQGPLPQHVFLSGRQPPHVPGPVLNVDTLNDATFLDAVGRRYNALPTELLANREILEIVLPSLRADFTLMERYQYQETAPIDVPFTLLNGADDPWIRAEALSEWQQHTRRPLQQRVFPGGHFYLPAAGKELRAAVLASLHA